MLNCKMDFEDMMRVNGLGISVLIQSSQVGMEGDTHSEGESGAHSGSIGG